MIDSIQPFYSEYYHSLNARRLEHLASLGIKVQGLNVLDVGAGIGDHAHYYLDRGCRVTLADNRQENILYMRSRFYGNRDAQVVFYDMAEEAQLEWDIVHCFHCLNYRENPMRVLRNIIKAAKNYLFLETPINVGENPLSRQEIFEIIKEEMHAYAPFTQPNHPEFPLDWNNLNPDQLHRQLFIGSTNHLKLNTLSDTLIGVQETSA